MQRPDAAQRTRLRQHSTSNINTATSPTPQSPLFAHCDTGTGSGNGTLTTSPANPLTSTPLLASHLPILRHVLPSPQILLPDDDADHVLPVVYAVLDRNGNRAMSLKELGEVAFSSGLLKTSPSAAQQSIGTHIRNHMQRHADNPQNALLSYYKLEGGSDDVRVGAALFRLSPRSGRKGTMVWFLSRATGKPCPFERIGVHVSNSAHPSSIIVSSPVTTTTTPTTTTATTATAAALSAATTTTATIPAILPPVVASLKRKIPPDDVADSHRPTKIRITLRLPPRTPIPKRPRPIVPSQFYSQLSQHPLASSDEDSSSSGNTDSSSEEEDDDDDDDEDMIDDFNSLLADDIPIAIPCARSGPTFCLSRPFYDTCEPPPDSEDEDEDFHNSMLRPELEEDEEIQPKEEDYFDIKEEEIADFVLDLATPESLIAAQHPVVVAVKVEDGVDVACQPMTARPELEWSGLKLDESMFNALDMLARTDSPAGSAEIEETGTSSVSPAPGAGGRGGSISAESSLALAVPPPTPWIKTEEESAILLDDKPSPHDGDVIEDDPFPIVDDHFAPVQSPMETLPIHQPPWEHEWVPSSSIGGGPESVTTDEVDLFESDPPQRDGIQASTSAPHFTPLSQPQPRARRPLRLSVSGLHPFHDGIRGHQSATTAAMRAGHARRHSHAAGITTSSHNRRMSIISNAFSDWASGTPEDSEAPLATPSHTAWRHYQWPGANGSSSTLAHERIEERSAVDEDGSAMEEEPKADSQRHSPPQQAQKQQQHSSSAPSKVDSPLSLKDELDQLLTSTTFNQVTIRALPAGHRMSTLVLLGIPVFQYSVEYPPIELIRRMDTDFINISSLIIYGRFVAQAATGRSRAQSNAAAPASQSTILPAPPTADELPPNHIMINSGARAINGGWVSLSVARSVAKNYHDLPTFVRRMFLSEGLADKFPEPIPYVKSLLASRRQQGEPGMNAFGKPFAKPSSLSAHELLAGPSATAAAAPGSPAAIVAAATAAGMGALSEANPLSPAVRRPGGPIGANPSGLAVSRSYPLSPVAALSNVNAIFGKAHPSEPSLLSLATALAPAKGWTAALGRTQPEPEEPLKPEEEEMLKAILKSPPRKSYTSPAVITADNDSDGDAEMSVDEDEEQEVVREVVDIGSEAEQEEERQVEAKVPETKATAPKRQQQQRAPNTRSKDQKKSPVVSVPPVPTPAPAPRRSLRRMQSISSLSSELTVSESESSAPPPSLDRRPALKGKSTNIQQPVSPVEPNGKKKGSNVTLPLRRNATEPARVKIIEVDEPTVFQKPRRSERMAKNEPAPTMTERSSKRLQKGATAPPPTTTSPVVIREDSPPPTAVVGKTRRSLAQQKEKESVVAAATPVAASPQVPTTRPGALRPTPAKRSLRSRG
ncbi:hypothetical protein CPB86DRAFT_336769 [Serendipita vermifera]|nr:hypothetical protein CPB86DRAFT_336769 [Serendipita vermifera]